VVKSRQLRQLATLVVIDRGKYDFSSHPCEQNKKNNLFKEGLNEN